MGHASREIDSINVGGTPNAKNDIILVVIATMNQEGYVFRFAPF